MESSNLQAVAGELCPKKSLWPGASNGAGTMVQGLQIKQVFAAGCGELFANFRQQSASNQEVRDWDPRGLKLLEIFET